MGVVLSIIAQCSLIPIPIWPADVYVVSDWKSNKQSFPPLVWEGWVQSWNDCRVKKRKTANTHKSWYFLWKEYLWSVVTNYWGWSASGHLGFFIYLLCLNVSYDCWCRVNFGEGSECEEKNSSVQTVICCVTCVMGLQWDRWSDEPFSENECGEGTIWPEPQQWNVCFTTHRSYHVLFFFLSH